MASQSFDTVRTDKFSTLVTDSTKFKDYTYTIEKCIDDVFQSKQRYVKVSETAEVPSDILLTQLIITMDTDPGVESGITKISKKESALMLSSTEDPGVLIILKDKTSSIDAFLLDIRSIICSIMGESVAFLDSIETIEQCKGISVKDVIDQHRSNQTPFNNLITGMRHGVFVQRYIMYTASDYGTAVKPQFNQNAEPVMLKVVDEEGVIEDYPSDDIEGEVEYLMAVSKGENVEFYRPYLKLSELIGSDNELQLFNERKQMYENLLEGAKIVHNRCDEDILHYREVANASIISSIPMDVRDANPTAKLCSILPGYIFYTNRDPHVHASLFLQYCKESAMLATDLLVNRNIHNLCDVKDNAYLDNLRVSNAVYNAVGKIGASASDKNGFICWSYKPVEAIDNPYEVECFSIGQLKNIELGKRQDLVLNSVVANNAVETLCVTLQFGVKEQGERKEDRMLQFELPSIQSCAVWVVGVQDQVSFTKKAKTILKGMKNERGVLASTETYEACEDNVLITKASIEHSKRTDVVLPANMVLDADNLIYIDTSYDAERALGRSLSDEEKAMFPFVRVGTLHSEALPFSSPSGLTLYPVSVDSPPFSELLTRNHVTLVSDGYIYSLYTYERYAIDVSGNVYNTDYPADKLMQVHIADLSTLPMCGITRTSNIFLDSDLSFVLFGDLDPAPGLRALTHIIASRDETDETVSSPKFTEDVEPKETNEKQNLIDLSSVDASYYEILRSALMAYCGLPLTAYELAPVEVPASPQAKPASPKVTPIVIPSPLSVTSEPSEPSEPAEPSPVHEEEEEEPQAEDEPPAPEPTLLEKKRRVIVKRIRKLIKGRHGEDLVEETIEEIFASDLDDDDQMKLFQTDNGIDSDDEEKKKDIFDPEEKERTLLKLRRGRVGTMLALKDVETVDYSAEIEADENDEHVNEIREKHMAMIQVEKTKLMGIKRIHETQLLEAQLAQKARLEQEKTMLEEARLAHVARIRSEEAKLLEEARLQAVRLEYQALMREEDNKLAQTRENVRKMINETASVYKVKTTEQVSEEKKMVEFKKAIEREQLEERMKREAEIAADLEELRLLRLEKDRNIQRTKEEQAKKDEEALQKKLEEEEKQRIQDEQDRITRAIEERLVREGKMLVDIDAGGNDEEYDEFDEAEYDAYTGQYYSANAHSSGADSAYSYNNNNKPNGKSSTSLPPPPPPFGKNNNLGVVDYETYYGEDVFTDEGYYDENGQYRTYGDKQSDFTMPQGVSDAISSGVGALNNMFNVNIDANGITNALTGGIQGAHTGGMNVAFMAQLMAMNGMNQAQIMAMTGLNQTEVLAATAQNKMADFASNMQNQLGALAGQAEGHMNAAQNAFGGLMTNVEGGLAQGQAALGQAQAQGLAALGQAQNQGLAALGQAQTQGLAALGQAQTQGLAMFGQLQGQAQTQAQVAQGQANAALGQGQAALGQAQAQGQVLAQNATAEGQKLAALAQTQGQSLALAGAMAGGDAAALQGKALGEANVFAANAKASGNSVLGGFGSSLGVGVTSTAEYDDDDDEEYLNEDEGDENAKYASSKSSSPANGKTGGGRTHARGKGRKAVGNDDDDDAYNKDEGEVDPVRRKKVEQSRGMCSSGGGDKKDEGGCSIM